MAVASMHLGAWHGCWCHNYTKNGVKREKHPVCGSPVGKMLSYQYGPTFIKNTLRKKGSLGFYI